MNLQQVRIAPLEEKDAEAYREVFDGVARERLYLAWLGDQAVGWCDVIEKPTQILAHSGVLGMGVSAEHRGSGIGTALMDATLKDARAKGFKRVELTVRIDNPRAKLLYERFDFVTEGLLRRHMRVDGEYKDSYLMAVLYD